MEKKRRSQVKMLLAYMLRGRSVTPLKALLLFGCPNLSTRVSELRKKYGVDIVSERREILHLFTYMRYRIDVKWLERNTGRGWLMWINGDAQ